MANIFSQYLQPVRSVTDRMADLDAQDFRREQLSGARQQNAIQALAMRRQMEAEESGRQQQAKFANYLQQSGGDVNALQKLLSADASMFERSQGLAKELGERDKTAAQTQQAQSAARKSEVDADKDRLAMARTQADAILQAVSAARDPASYAQAVQWLGSQGIDTSSIPQQFDPKFVQTAGQQAMTVKERADQEWKAKGYDLDVQKAAVQKRASEQSTAQGWSRIAEDKRQFGIREQRESGAAVADAGGPAQSALTKSFGKPPAGYRWKTDGSLESIPGGPTDRKANEQTAGKETVDNVVASLRSNYDSLEKGGGITSTGKGALSNIGAAISKSAPGQIAGGAVGSKNQKERDSIAQTRPLLLQAIMKATGMSAKQMDSNAELKLYLATATDPQLSLEANREALDRIEQLYGSAAVGKAPSPAPKPTEPAKVSGDADYNALPSGAMFVGPDGKTRRKP